MKIVVNPEMTHLRHFIEQLPRLFSTAGELMHNGRNHIRAFNVGGEQLVVKRYQRPRSFNRFIYSYIRKNKARRAYEHALQLREMGIDTPEPIAWSEYRRRGLITDTYFISRRSNYTSLVEATANFPVSGSRPLLSAFARFTVQLHEKGIFHADFNQTNILWARDETLGCYRFQLIDINRMKFLARPLSRGDSMVSLRRLGCGAVPYLYILDRYAAARGLDIDETMLRGTFFRLLFGYRQQFKKHIRERRLATAGKKQG